MKRLDVNREGIDLKAYKERGALPSDYSELITEDCEVYENGRMILLYIKPDEKMSAVRSACNAIKYAKDIRTSGMVTTSRVFGFEPRKPLRKDFCAVTSLANEAPSHHDNIMNAGKAVAKAYAEHNPELFARHQKLSEENLSFEYRIDGMPFTSGIVNKNNPLKYHFDTGNYRDVWSGMITLKDGIKGGHLALPEFGLGVELADSTFFMFDGQGILHGVTPIERTRPDAKRFTIVYYSLRQMWKCETVTDELVRIRKRRTARERFGAREAYIAKLRTEGIYE